MFAHICGELSVVHWMRRRRHDGLTSIVPMQGLDGRIDLENGRQASRVLLALAEDAQMGSGTVSGLRAVECA